MNKPTEQQQYFGLTYWALVSALFLVIDVAWNIYSPRTVLYDTMFFTWLRVLVLCFSLAVSLLIYALTSLLFSRLLVAGKLKSTSRYISFILFACFSGFIFLYTSSWLSLHYTGLFLNLDIFRMLANDPVQLMQHVTHISPLSIVFSVLATFGIAWFLGFRLPVITARFSNDTHYKLRKTIKILASVIIVAGLSSVLYLQNAGGKITDPETGIGYTPMERFNESVSQRSGPITSVIWEIKNDLSNIADDYASESNSSLVITKNAISMDSYLKQAHLKHKKNVIILLVESLRADQFPAFGGKDNIMPSLQELASHSLLYPNAYATSSHSNYSDVAPLSSHYPLRSINVHYYPENPTYPRVLLQDILKPLGYRTAIISSQNEHWGNMINYLDTGNVDYILHAENYKGVLRKSLANNSDPDDPLMGKRKQGKIDDKFTVNEAIKWISQPSDKPFMMYMNLQSSHFPYDVTDTYLKGEEYNKATLPRFMGANLGIVDKKAFKTAYQNSLRYIDQQVSRLLDYLKNNAMLDDTIIVVSADTGTAFFEHGQWGNGADLYNEVVKVPLFIYNSDYPHKVDNALSGHIDIMPTILDMLGLPKHPSPQGISLVDPKNNNRDNRPVFLVCQSPAGYQYAVVKNNWKLIFDGESGKKILYRLDGEHPEKKDFSDEEKQLNEEMTSLLFTWMNSQIDFYQQIQRHKTEYPPVIRFKQ